MPISFFSKLPAKDLWKSVVSVSNAGAKRGRGKGLGRAIAKDYNKGQYIGEGRRKIILPGLNSPLTAGLKKNVVQEVGDNTEFTQKIKDARQRQNTFRKYPVHPLERGWSGRKAQGKLVGPPDEVDEISFEGFQSTILSSRSELIMTGLGRVKNFHAIVVTGNGRGAAGFAEVKSKDINNGLKMARNRAGLGIVHVPIWDNHTIMHDFFSKYMSTTVYAHRKPKGYGIRSGRVIKAICEAFGIKDIKVEIDGNKYNTSSLTKAFFLGLMNQKSYEEMAEDKKLHLVDVREENFFYPRVLASPKSIIKTESEIARFNENLNFTYYIYDGKIRCVKPRRSNIYEGTESWQTHLDRVDLCKNREEVRLRLAAKYGPSRVLDVFPLFVSNAESFKETQTDDV